jgi:hypothetical protein
VSNDRLKYDRRWIERLQELPQYRLVVEKLLQGWSLDAVADWIMEQADRGALSDLKRSTIRYYLHALNIRLKESANASRRRPLTLRAQRLARVVDEFITGMTARTEVAAEPPVPTDEEVKAKQKQHFKSLIDDLTSDRLVRLMLERHLPYVIRLGKIEEMSKIPPSVWARMMSVFIDAATILQENEVAQKLFGSQVQTRVPIPESRPTESADRITNFAEVDRQLISDTQERFRSLLKCRREEAT